jgi:hypothetical protein
VHVSIKKRMAMRVDVSGGQARTDVRDVRRIT